jgi:hypothetical protein
VPEDLLLQVAVFYKLKNKLLTIMLIGPRINAYFIARSSGLFYPAEEKNIYSIIQIYNIYND